MSSENAKQVQRKLIASDHAQAWADEFNLLWVNRSSVGSDTFIGFNLAIASFTLSMINAIGETPKMRNELRLAAMECQKMIFEEAAENE